uniref:hypothetical protein n=1 Tax=Pantoea ananas TaxID=553 RepID=UPI001E41B8BC
LEYLPVTQGVAGSSPVRSAKFRRHAGYQHGVFAFLASKTPKQFPFIQATKVLMLPNKNVVSRQHD